MANFECGFGNLFSQILGIYSTVFLERNHNSMSDNTSSFRSYPNNIDAKISLLLSLTENADVVFMNLSVNGFDQLNCALRRNTDECSPNLLLIAYSIETVEQKLQLLADLLLGHAWTFYWQLCEQAFLLFLHLFLHLFLYTDQLCRLYLCFLWFELLFRFFLIPRLYRILLDGCLDFLNQLICLDVLYVVFRWLLAFRTRRHWFGSFAIETVDLWFEPINLILEKLLVIYIFLQSSFKLIVEFHELSVLFRILFNGFPFLCELLFQIRFTTLFQLSLLLFINCFSL